MAQHNASRRAVLRSSLKHKFTADTLLDTIEELTANIATARAKIAADTNTTWDTDYVATAGVTLIEMDEPTVGQHKATMRKTIVDKMAHKRLGNEIADLLEEAQVTLNGILAQMDADAGTLSGDPTYEAFRIASPLDVDAAGTGPHKASFKKTLIVAIKHKAFGTSLADEMAAIESELNAMIDDIQAAN